MATGTPPAQVGRGRKVVLHPTKDEARIEGPDHHAQVVRLGDREKLRVVKLHFPDDRSENYDQAVAYADLWRRFDAGTDRRTVVLALPPGHDVEILEEP